MNPQLESIYRQRTTQELHILTMDEHPGNHQGQQLRGRRGVRMHGGRVQRQNRGRGRRGQGQRRISDEIRATAVDHVVNHGLTMAEAGWRVQLNIGRLTISSIIQTFRNSLFQSISHIHYSFSQSLWCISQIRNDIFKTTCSTSTSSSHLCTS